MNGSKLLRRSARAAFGLGICYAGEDTGGGGTPAPDLTWAQSVNRLREIETELTRLSELDELGGDAKRYFEELSTEFDKVDAHRQRLEREATLNRIRGAARHIDVRNPGTGSPLGVQPGAPTGDDYDSDPLRDPDSVSAGRYRDPWDLREMRTFGRSPEEVSGDFRSRAMSAIEKMPAASDKVREAATKIIERWDDKNASLSRQLLASSSPAYLRAFSKMATNRPEMLSEDERRALDQVRAMSLTTTAGGFLVPFQLDPTVILTADGSLNEIRQIARTVVATGNKWHGVSSGSVSWSWDGEGDQVSDDATTFAQPAVDIFKANGFVPISLEALEDEANVAASVARLLADGRDTLEAAAFITGTGSGEPHGIVDALVDASTPIKPSAGSDTLAVGDVYALQGALPARHRARSSWLAHNLFYNKCRQFDSYGGSSLWAQLGDGRPGNLLGRPVYEAEDMDGVINAAGENYMAILGDFSNFVIADRVGMTVEFIPHLFQQTTAGTGFGRPTGQRGWFAYYRVGSDVVNSAAFKILNVT